MISLREKFKVSLLFVIILFSSNFAFHLGWEENLLMVTFLVAFLMRFGVSKESLVYGISFSFIFELFKGIFFGLVTIPFLLCGLMFHSLSNFLDFRNLSGRLSIKTILILSFLSLVGVYLFSLLFILAAGAVYGFEFSYFPLEFILVAGPVYIFATSYVFFLIFRKSQSHES